MENQKISPDQISALSETMLIPLWAKAVEYGHPRPLLKDAEAVRMMGMINYDFDKFARASASQAGCCGRAALIDEEVMRFLAGHPDGVVVQLGAGLDARFERLGRPGLTAWYDLDLPDVLDVRRMLLPESGNHYLPASLFDESWTQTAAAHGKPVLLVSEGVLMYFEEERVKAFFAMVNKLLPGAELVFDVIPPLLLKQAKRHDALGKMEKPPEFKWALPDPKSLEGWLPGLRVEKVSGLMERCVHRYPWLLRLLYKTAWGRNNADQKIITVKFGGQG
ncbi:MAG: class I SAM-dependent methyltransferase [Neisseria sp.]|nr:class I SAM-dependent methyltransferase [Neisseria sp.]